MCCFALVISFYVVHKWLLVFILDLDLLMLLLCMYMCSVRGCVKGGYFWCKLSRVSTCIYITTCACAVVMLYCKCV